MYEDMPALEPMLPDEECSDSISETTTNNSKEDERSARSSASLSPREISKAHQKNQKQGCPRPRKRSAPGFALAIGCQQSPIPVPQKPESPETHQNMMEVLNKATDKIALESEKSPPAGIQKKARAVQPGKSFSRPHGRRYIPILPATEPTRRRSDDSTQATAMEVCPAQNSKRRRADGEEEDDRQDEVRKDGDRKSIEPLATGGDKKKRGETEVTTSAPTTKENNPENLARSVKKEGDDGWTDLAEKFDESFSQKLKQFNRRRPIQLPVQKYLQIQQHPQPVLPSNPVVRPQHRLGNSSSLRSPDGDQGYQMPQQQLHRPRINGPNRPRVIPQTHIGPDQLHQNSTVSDRRPNPANKDSTPPPSSQSPPPASQAAPLAQLPVRPPNMKEPVRPVLGELFEENEYLELEPVAPNGKINFILWTPVEYAQWVGQIMNNRKGKEMIDLIIKDEHEGIYVEEFLTSHTEMKELYKLDDRQLLKIQYYCKATINRQKKAVYKKKLEQYEQDMMIYKQLH